VGKVGINMGRDHDGGREKRERRETVGIGGGGAKRRMGEKGRWARETGERQRREHRRETEKRAQRN